MSEERDEGEDLDILDELLEPELDAEPEELDETEPSEEQPQEQRKPSSRQRAIIRMRERLAREEAENRQLRDQLLQQTRYVPQAPQPDPYRQAEAERQEAERVAQMMPHEQAQYYARKSEQNFQQQLMRQNLETRDLLDRQLFNSLCQQEPMAQRLASEVENTLAQARAQNMNPTREAIYNLLVGQEVRNRAKKETEKQRKNGRAQIAAQTTQPGGSRSTVGRSRAAQDQEAGLDDRLRKVSVGDVW